MLLKSVHPIRKLKMEVQRELGGVIALKATSLLGDSKLPGKLWPEAVTTAGYLLNRTPMRILN
jgi:hypothetical protein